MNTWKSPGLRHQWGLGNSTSIKAPFKLCSHKQNHCAQYRTCKNALGCRFLEWSTNLRCATNSLLQTSTSIAKTKIFKSGLFQFILSSVLLCKITHRKENRLLSMIPVFFLFSFCFAFCNNSMRLRKGNGWEACGQQWGERSNKKLSGCEAETVYCASGLLAGHLLMRDGWHLYHLC